MLTKLKQAYVIGVITLIALLALTGLVWFFGWGFVSTPWRGLRTTAFIWLPLLGLLFLTGLFFFIGAPQRRVVAREDRTYSRVYSYKETRKMNGREIAGRFGVGTLIVLGLAATIVGWVRFGYDQDKIYARTITVTDEAAPNFSERAPFDVAVESSHRNLENVTGNALNTRMVADAGDHGTWNALVERRGAFAGYEATQVVNVPLYNSVRGDDVTICYFDKELANKRGSGFWPTNNLGREIRFNISWNETWDNSDVYSFCDGETPMVVIPLQRIDGLYHVTYSPAGVALYNGKTGELSIYDDVDNSGGVGNITTEGTTVRGVPGPAYPMTLVRRVRESAAALGTFADYWFQRSGYNDTSNDADNPNGGNRSEFALRNADTNMAYYATPLTPRGSAVNITALGYSDAANSSYGARAAFTISRIDPARPANSTSAANIRSENPYLPWASGIEVFEVVPGENGSFVASIGQRQSVIYRAVLDATGNTTLYRADGSVVTEANSNSSGDGTDVTDGGDETTPVPTPSTSVDPNADLENLTPQQLAELSKQIADELARRASETSAG